MNMLDTFLQHHYTCNTKSTIMFSILTGMNVNRYPNEPAFVLPECLEKMVEKGNLGRKSGKGFYHWEGDKRGDPVA